jgi:predicted TIM-barrel fold metal-dependent hydrolase
MHYRTLLAPAAISLFLLSMVRAEDPSDIRELKLRDWAPRSMLVTKATKVDKPMFPVIDDHNHLGTGKAFLTPQRVNYYLQEMDAAGVRTVVDLDGMWGDALRETLAALDEAHPGRFLTFAQINFDGLDDEDWSRREADRLEQSFNMGAKGLKFHKSLGLDYRFKDGKYLMPDDVKMDPIYEMCAKHHRPIMIHTADPAAFFTALDKNNERWHELNQHPGWLFYGKDFPRRQALLDGFIHAVAKHPRTTFIGAHFGNNVEDLPTVAKWLDAYPNLVIDIDARISELGRLPYTARKFLIKYQDRVMFGTDTTCKREAYRIYYRFLETDDEYFDCAASHHLQGFWMIYGVFLPKDVLEKIYCKNAERLLYFGNGKSVSSPAPAGGLRETLATRTADNRGSSTQIQSAETATIAPAKAISQQPAERSIHVRRTDDFPLTGDGKAAAWKTTAWTTLQKRSGGKLDYNARFKILHSLSGVYVLMNGSDRKVTASIDRDFTDLWHEDVFEFFFWPDPKEPLYLEYEISPLAHELVLLVPNLDNAQMGWRPWHYEGPRKTRKAVCISRAAAPGSEEVVGWTAEVFVPYDVFKPLRNVPPQAGTQWRANFYRVDYDDQRATAWSWTPVGPSFHEYEKFGTLLFD